MTVVSQNFVKHLYDTAVCILG